jgi:hypothetical protein
MKETEYVVYLWLITACIIGVFLFVYCLKDLLKKK